MSIVEKIRHNTQTAKEKAREVAGRINGNRRSKASGRMDQARGNVMLAAGKVKDAFKH